MSSDSEVDERIARQRDGTSRWGVIALVLGLLAWALVLAIGAYLSGFMRNWPEGYQNTALMKFGILVVRLRLEVATSLTVWNGLR